MPGVTPKCAPDSATENISSDLYLTRMRVNVEFPLNRRPSKYDWHVDNGMYKDSNLHKISKAMVIYINTTNGYTEFKNKELGKVYSVRNRALIFPGGLEHRGVCQKDKYARFVINVNYIPWYWE